MCALFLCGLLFTRWLWDQVPDPLEAVRTWPVSPVILDKTGTVIHARLSIDEEWCLPVALEDMGHWLPKVLVAVEDKRFYKHHGVDLLALARALTQNIFSGRIRSGASTITSQLVRLSTPRSRTFSTKVVEFIGAWKLERSLDKNTILEYYLNRAPFGGPIRGVEAAARLYFDKRAKELSLGEASLLVGLLKGPTAYRPDKNPQAALRRRQFIITKVSLQSGLDKNMTALAMDEPLPAFKPSMPTTAWHFADLALKTLPPEGGIVHSTLDKRAQELLERSLTEQLARAGHDVTAAGVIIENNTGAILAYVGNIRFDPLSGRQWVDCATAPRSPGSTLKPFIYLGAMEEGHIVPASLLADTPLQLGGEAPRNFDRHYRGPVTAGTALADSLNAPAVRVMRLLGVHNALGLLRKAGFSHLDRANSDYGDSLVLGAGEVTLLELARAYTTLANLGEDRPLLLYQPRSSEGLPSAEVRFPMAHAVLPQGLASYRQQLTAGHDAGLPRSGRMYSAAAAFLIAEILKDPGRLPFIDQLVQAREQSPVAFKTGTSFGLRDAWTAAYTPEYTTVVWFGRTGGQSDQRLIGISLAAPCAIRIIRALPTTTKLKDGWYERPSGLGQATVCALSGAAASPFCPTTRVVSTIEKTWRTAPCSFHRLRDGKTALDWPPELEDFQQKRFARIDRSRAAYIVSPMPDARYILTPGGRNQPVALKAEGVTYPVHWYVDGEYLGKQERLDLPLYWVLRGGDHFISLLDQDERTGSATIKVTDLEAERKANELPLIE